MAFADVLRHVRQKQGMTQRELAELVELSDRAISHYELGRSIPSLELAYKLARALNIRIDDFFAEPLNVGIKNIEDPYDFGWELNSHLLLEYVVRMYADPEFPLKSRQRFLNRIIEIYLQYEGLVDIEKDSSTSLDISLMDSLELDEFRIAATELETSTF